MNGKVKEPFVRITKREDIVRFRAWGIRLVSILFALIVCAGIIFLMIRLNPLKVYAAMWDGAFGTSKRSWITARDTMMLLCIGVGLAPAFKMRFWNIGAEGQILAGGLATAACMIYFGRSIPTWALLLVSFGASCIAGALWGFVPAAFKARFDTNETLFTLMMNYVAIQLTSFFITKWENPIGSNTVGIINQSTKAGWLPAFLGQQYMLNIVIVMTLTVAVYIYLRWSKHGYEITVVGESERTANYIGINVKKVVMRTVALSGALCGVAGFLAVSGASHTISTNTAGGRGFTAIIVAWLAKFNPLIMLFVSLLLAFLQKGAVEIASRYDLNDYASQMITGVILFFILGSEFFINYKLIFRGSKEEN